jgi:hypothetical protein
MHASSPAQYRKSFPPKDSYLVAILVHLFSHALSFSKIREAFPPFLLLTIPDMLLAALLSLH